MRAITDPFAQIRNLPRRHLAYLPTPLEPMPRLGHAIGIDADWVKRDDCAGLDSDGNKVGELESI